MMDDDTLRAAFAAHKEGQTKFTRRMAINIADMSGESPRAIVQRLERLSLLKAGAWNWFRRNGGITHKHVEEARADRRASA